jgi:hypothetical protein
MPLQPATVRPWCLSSPSPKGIDMVDEISEKTPDLSISREKVSYIIAKAGEFDSSRRSPPRSSA